MGHPLPFVRDFSSKSFTIITRKLAPKDFLGHVNKLLTVLTKNGHAVNGGALAPIEPAPTFPATAILTGSHSALLEENANMRYRSGETDIAQSGLQSSKLKESFSLENETGGAESISVHVDSNKQRKLNDLFAGVTLLFFYTLKGAKCCLHSKGAARLTIILSNILSPPKAEALRGDDIFRGIAAEKLLKQLLREVSQSGTEERRTDTTETAKVLEGILGIEKVDSSVSSAVRSFYSGLIGGDVFVRLFRHIHPQNSLPLWEAVCGSLRALLSLLRCAMTLLEQDKARETVGVMHSLSMATSCSLELVLFALQHSDGRGLSCQPVKAAISKILIESTLGFSQLLLSPIFHKSLRYRARVLLFTVSKQFHDFPDFKLKLHSALNNTICIKSPTDDSIVDIVEQISSQLLRFDEKGRSSNQLPNNALIGICVPYLLKGVRKSFESDFCVSCEALYALLMSLYDCRGEMSSYFHSIAKDRPADVDRSRNTSSIMRDDIVDALGDSERFYEDGDEDYDSDGEDGKAEDTIRKTWSRSFGGSVQQAQNQEKGRYETMDINGLFAECEDDLSALLAYCTEMVIKLCKSSTWKTPELGSAIIATKCLLWAASSCRSAILPDKYGEIVAAIENVLFSAQETNKSKKQAQQSTESLVSIFEKHLVSSRIEGNENLNFSCHLMALWAIISINTESIFSIAGKDQVDSTALIVSKIANWLRICSEQTQLGGRSLVFSWALNITLSKLRVEKSEIGGSCFLMSPQYDDLIPVLADALRTPSRWLRLNILHLLTHFAPPHVQSANNAGTDGTAIELMNVCIHAAQVSIGIASTRIYTQYMETLEVLVRNERLTKPYLEIVGGLCLGILQVQFKPFWQPAMAVLTAAVAASSASEEALWPLIFKQLVALRDIANKQTAPSSQMQSKLSVKFAVNSLASFSIDSGKDKLSVELSHSSAFYFALEVTQHEGELEGGQEDLRVDSETALMNLLALLKKMPAVILKRSNEVIPVFTRYDSVCNLSF